MGLPPVARQNETMTSSLLGRGGTITLEKVEAAVFPRNNPENLLTPSTNTIPARTGWKVLKSVGARSSGRG